MRLFRRRLPRPDYARIRELERELQVLDWREACATGETTAYYARWGLDRISARITVPR